MRQIEWTEPARADVRRLDKRLRIGDYWLRFSEKGDTLQILRVLHRSQAYR